MTDDSLLPVGHVAKMIGKDRSTLYAHIRKGHMHAEKINGVWWMANAEIDRYLAEISGRIGIKYPDSYPPAETRFWAKVNKDGPTPAHCPELGPCWIWTASLGTNGYGQFKAERKILAHRYSYQLAYGRVEDGALVLHRCDNPVCVRPSHLFSGTQADNIRDMMTKGRAAVPKRRDDSHPPVRLRVDDVIAIRQRVSNGERQCDIAREFGVSAHHVMRIISGAKWKNVPQTWPVTGGAE